MNATTNYYKRIPLFLVLVFLVVVVGFTPTYFNSFTQIGSVFHYHAIPAILWLILLIVQPILFSMGKIKVHRLVGLFSLFIALLVFLGNLLIINQMLTVTFNEDGSNEEYQFAFSSFALSFGFVLFVVLAYINRKNIHIHSRYMISTAFFALVPGLIRLFDVSLALNTTITYTISIGLIFILILIDFFNKKQYLPYLILFMWFSLIAIIFPSIHECDWWVKLVDSYRL